MQRSNPSSRKYGASMAMRHKLTPAKMRAGRLSLAITAVACIAALAGCADERPQSTTTRGLDTGITSSNGGGMRATGNTLNQGVTTKVP